MAFRLAGAAGGDGEIRKDEARDERCAFAETEAAAAARSDPNRCAEARRDGMVTIECGI